MNKKQLTDLGLTEEQAEQVVIQNGMDIEAVKAKYSPLETEVTTLRTQLDEAGTTIEGFKSMDIDAIKASADEWKTRAEAARVEAEDQVYQMQFEHVLERKLHGANALDPLTVMPLLDYDKLDLSEDGQSIVGLDEQLPGIVESRPFLFGSDEAEPRVVLGGHNHSVISDATVDAARKAAGLTPAKE